MHPLKAWLHRLWPQAYTSAPRERLLACLGAGLGLFITEWISRTSLGTAEPWFIAPMGASAIILFALPQSPLAQPWALIGGNLVAGLVGVTCAQWLGHGGLAIALAVALSLGLMLALLAGVLQFAFFKALLMVAVVFGAGQILESFWLTPRWVGERIGLHPLAVIFALLAFGQLFGFVGILVALPVSAVLLVAMRRLKKNYFASDLYRGPQA